MIAIVIIVGSMRSDNSLQRCVSAQAGITRADLPAGRQVMVRDDYPPYGEKRPSRGREM